MTTRVVFSGLFIVGVGALYYGVISPIANVPIPADYRFPFSFEANIYLLFVVAYGVHFVYRLLRPSPAAMGEMGQGRKSASAVIGMILRAAFLLSVGGSYLTGAMIATPGIFNVAPSITGLSVVFFANYLHGFFAISLIVLGILILINEVIRVGRGEQTAREWLFSARYPEIKLLYWIIAILVIAQGTLGLFLLGTISPVGPFSLIGSNVYGFEDLIRHIHGPMGAVIISVFYGHVYLRIRPEYSIR